MRSLICPELTLRECEVRKHLTHGLTNREIAYKMHSTLFAIDAHTSRMIAKLALNSRVQMAVYALKSGLVRLEDIELRND
jgi:DNA-binding NarL/FixJ family response regulator